MKEIEEKFIRSRGKGGQNVNKVATCVVLKHLPTGLIVRCDKYRSQAQNRNEAYRLLEQKLQQREEQKIAVAKAKLAKERRQKRRRSRASKEEMLAGKKRQSQKKTLRRKVAWE